MKDKAHDDFLVALRGLEGTQLPLAKGELETPATSGTDEDNMAEDKPYQGGQSEWKAHRRPNGRRCSKRVAKLLVFKQKKRPIFLKAI